MRRAVAVSWWVLGSVIAALLMAWLWPRSPGEVPAGAASVLRIARAAASAPSRGVVSSLASGGDAALVEHGSDEVNLCGDRWLKVNPDGSVDDAAFDHAIGLSDARVRMLAALRADPSDFSRAAAMRLAMTPAWGGSGSPDVLARFAATSNDPRVYALAFSACQLTTGGEASAVTSNACQQLNSAQWARLDAGNAVPWLMALAEARARRDAAGQADALFHIAQSSRNDDRFLGLTGELLAHAPSDDPGLPATLAMTVDAAGIDAARAIPPYQGLTALCDGASLNDVNRRQICAGVAELLFTNSDTLMANRIGAAIGRRLGWTSERIDAERGEETGYFAAMLTQRSAGPRDACAGMRSDLSDFRERARLGEAGAIRAWAAQSGLQAVDFIRIEREATAQRLSDAASAASASAAAPASAVDGTASVATPGPVPVAAPNPTPVAASVSTPPQAPPSASSAGV